jgi:hypothetical protein
MLRNVRCFSTDCTAWCHGTAVRISNPQLHSNSVSFSLLHSHTVRPFLYSKSFIRDLWWKKTRWEVGFTSGCFWLSLPVIIWLTDLSPPPPKCSIFLAQVRDGLQIWSFSLTRHLTSWTLKKLVLCRIYVHPSQKNKIYAWADTICDSWFSHRWL